MILTHRQSTRYVPIGLRHVSDGLLRVYVAIVASFLMLQTACFSQELLPVFEAQKVVVVDGDTVKCEIEVWDGIWVRKTIRSTYDTWESYHSRNSANFKNKSDAWWKEEQRKGELAKAYLVKLLSEGKLYLSPANQSTYGRDVCHFYYQPNKKDAPLQSLGDMMKKEGHLRDE